MKKFYTFIALSLIVTTFTYAQGYKLGIVHLADNHFKVVAVPDFNATNIDASDIGFTLMLPAGNADIINQVGLFRGNSWTNIQQHDAAFLTSMGLGDGTRDAFVFNLPPGQNIYSHNIGDQIDLVSFDISNLSTATGNMYFLLNTDSIATGAGGVLDSFFNSNIDGTTTKDYFGGLVTGMDSYSFSSTASINDLALVNFNLYPNPVNSVLHINAEEKINQISIYNILGQEVIRIAPSTLSTEIDLSNLASGTYLIRAQVGTHTGTYKIIKQ